MQKCLRGVLQTFLEESLSVLAVAIVFTDLILKLLLQPTTFCSPIDFATYQFMVGSSAGLRVVSPRGG